MRLEFLCDQTIKGVNGFRDDWRGRCQSSQRVFTRLTVENIVRTDYSIIYIVLLECREQCAMPGTTHPQDARARHETLEYEVSRFPVGIPLKRLQVARLANRARHGPSTCRHPCQAQPGLAGKVTTGSRSRICAGTC